MPPAAAGAAGRPEPPRGGRGAGTDRRPVVEEEVFEIGADGFDLGAILDGGRGAARGRGGGNPAKLTSAACSTA